MMGRGRPARSRQGAQLAQSRRGAVRALSRLEAVLAQSTRGPELAQWRRPEDLGDGLLHPRYRLLHPSKFVPRPLRVPLLIVPAARPRRALPHAHTLCVLLALHAQLCELLRKDAGIEVPDTFRLDHWVPRCAVAVACPAGAWRRPSACFGNSSCCPSQGTVWTWH
uniref:Uncharacterized protein n=1 Tax=Arundo donax TaxID=35708 RepID=A0A0A8XRF0_ARUDO